MNYGYTLQCGWISNAEKKDPKQRKCTYDSIYMILENKINVQKADQWLPGDGG